MSIVNNICDRCRSDRAGYLCSCGEMRCSCEPGGCPICQQHEEYEEQQQRYEQEQGEREDFENEMEHKYHH